MGARARASAEAALAMGWHAEAFARTKKMKSLDEYLKPPLSIDQQRSKGADDVRRMFERMIAKQGGR